MIRFVISFTIVLLTTTFAFAHVTHYKKINSLHYNLYRNDKLIGFHNFKFERNGDILKVNSVIEFKINKLGVELYKYTAKSLATYKNDQLLEFSSKTNQNKKEKYLNMKFDKEKDKFIIDGSSYKGDAAKNMKIGTWWNHEIVDAEAQISAVSGRIIPQKVTFLGKKKINLSGKKFDALHFNFSSSDKKISKKKKLDTDIWYDEKTKIWIKAAFDKSGYWEYRLKSIN